MSGGGEKFVMTSLDEVRFGEPPAAPQAPFAFDPDEPREPAGSPEGGEWGSGGGGHPLLEGALSAPKTLPQLTKFTGLPKAELLHHLRALTRAGRLEHGVNARGTPTYRITHAAAPATHTPAAAPAGPSGLPRKPTGAVDALHLIAHERYSYSQAVPVAEVAHALGVPEADALRQLHAARGEGLSVSPGRDGKPTAYIDKGPGGLSRLRPEPTTATPAQKAAVKSGLEGALAGVPAGKLVPVHELRAKVPAPDKAAFDDAARSLWREGKVRLVSLADLQKATAAQLDASIPGTNETFFYLEPTASARFSLDSPDLSGLGDLLNLSRQEVLDALFDAALDSFDLALPDAAFGAPDQPRLPAGQAGGGEWTSGGGGVGAGAGDDRVARRAAGDARRARAAARQEVAEARYREKAAEIRAKVDPAHAAVVLDAVTQLLPKYFRRGRFGGADSDSVPEGALLDELDRRGLLDAKRVYPAKVHQLLARMVFLGDLVRVEEGTGDVLGSRKNVSYALPRKADAPFYSPDQPRDELGRWTEGYGTAERPGFTPDQHRERRQAASDAVRAFALGQGPPTRAEAEALAGHLAKLTVSQIHALKAEHGLKGSAPNKAALVAKMAQRFRTWRESRAPKEAVPDWPEGYDVFGKRDVFADEPHDAGTLAPVPAPAIPDGPTLEAGKLTQLTGVGGSVPVYRVDAGGRAYFVKQARGGPAGEPNPFLGNETAVAELARVAGVDAPAVRAVTFRGREALAAEWLPGKAVIDTPGGKAAVAALPPAEVARHLLFAFLADVDDRHLGNYVLSGGKLYSIDHEFAFESPDAETSARGLAGGELFDAVGGPSGKTPGRGYNYPVPAAVARDLAAAAPGMAEALRARGMAAQADDVAARGRVLASLARDPSPTVGGLLRRLGWHMREGYFP